MHRHRAPVPPGDQGPGGAALHTAQSGGSAPTARNPRLRLSGTLAAGVPFFFIYLFILFYFLNYYYYY